MKYRFAFAIVSVFFASFLHAQSLQVQELTCEHFTDPLGVTADRPVLAWQLTATGTNVLQRACQVLVADRPELLDEQHSNTWNSGKVFTDESVNFLYKGKKLLPAHTYYWKVRVWDNKGNASAWSVSARFTTGLFNRADWGHARWIGYEALEDSMRVVPGVHSPDKKKIPAGRVVKRAVVPLFRKEFTAGREIAQALVFISGLGQYEMTVNGKKAGDGFLTPGWTYYDKRCLYNTYDVTNLLTQGRNAVGVIVGNGFYYINRERYFKVLTAYGLPELLCKIQVTYKDGTQEEIVSGEDWKTAPSPIVFTSMYGGEDYDARLEQQGWDKPGFADNSWKQALPVQAPKGGLQAEQDYPVGVRLALDVKAVSEPKTGVKVYDFGQNASGIAELRVKGKKGQSVRLTPGELLLDDGLVNQKATGKPYYYSYTLKGDGEEVWRPRFTYYGFRYVQVETAPDTVNGLTELPEVAAVRMLHTGNTAPVAGEFASGNTLFNNISKLIQSAIFSNVQSVATDCPHREKLSWLEQDYLMGGSIQHTINVYHLYRKLVLDMMDAQTPEGMIPDIAPEFVFFDDHGFGFRDSPEWGSAGVILPWLVYRWYGDTSLMRTAWPMMQRYVQYLSSRAVNGIIDYGLGDWYDLGPQRPGVAQLTPKALTATAIFYYDIQLMRQMAALLHLPQETAAYAQQAAQVKQAFNNRFFDKQHKVYATGSQTAMAMPLCVGLVNETDRKQVFLNLTDSIIAGDKKLTAGDIGFHFLVQALQDGGAAQLLYDMNNRDDVPGYGYQLKKGATALTESWQALKEVSNNHLMLGHILEWMYEGLAGIQQADKSAGYRDLVIQPSPVSGITQVKAGYQTQYGMVVSNWNTDENTHAFQLRVTIPVNTRATVYLPAKPGSVVTESGRSVPVLRYSNGYAVIKTGSGQYFYQVKP